MTDYFSNVWIAFLSDNIARDVIKRSSKSCPGCKDKLGSPLLHAHVQDSLLTKLEKHFAESQGFLLKQLEQLYDRFKDHLPHSNDKDKDKEIYIDAARSFILHSTSHSIMYGLYVNPITDDTVKQVNSKNKKRKLSKTKDDGNESDFIEALLNGTLPEPAPACKVRVRYDDDIFP